MNINFLYVNRDTDRTPIKMETYNHILTNGSALWKLHFYKEQNRYACKWNIKGQCIFYLT